MDTPQKDTSHPKREEELMAFWQEKGIFEKSLKIREGAAPYIFYDGPPFATGVPHYGHLLGSIAKDVVPRYWTMRGKYVRRRWGWDCHGLPIESLIEKKLGISGKKQIEEIGEDKFNEACASAVLEFTHEWKKTVDRIGRWVEFDNAYKTMDPTYMESVWWALKRMWDKDQIYEGRKVLMYCPRCETPVSKAEVTMDNSYKDVTEESVIAKFRVTNPEKAGLPTDAPVYILAWTTTPWTLPSNEALAVSVELEYLVVKSPGFIDHPTIETHGVGGQIVEQSTITGGYYIFAKNLWPKYLDKILTSSMDDLVEIANGTKDVSELNNVSVIKGQDLVGLHYKPLFDVPAIVQAATETDRLYTVADADFVTDGDGTGVVHIAPMYGEDDFKLGESLGLPLVPLVDAAGRFNDKAPEELRGLYIKKAAHVQERHATQVVLKHLKDGKLLFVTPEQYTHSYPHCWRCDTALIYNAISAWFIDIDSVREKMLQTNEQVNWYPEHLKHGRFRNVIETAPDWNISRNRYWATPLPFWKCDDASCITAVCVGSVAELKQHALNFDDVFATDNVAELDLHKHVVDKVKLKCPTCGKSMSRIAEVIDCWVESAVMPFAEFHYPFENKEVVEKRVHGEGHYIAEYISQTRAWFYYMHAISALLPEVYQNKPAFQNVVTTGVVLNEKGEKMSKSKKNFPDPWLIIEKYGVDALRYYLMSSPVMKSDDLFFSEKGVDEVYKKLVLITRNVLSFYETYAANVGTGRDLSLPESANVLDQWMIARTRQLQMEMTRLMDSYQIADATRLLIPFVDDLSTWYLRRSRDRMKAEDATQVTAILGWTLRSFAIAAAPFVPYLAEHVYQAVGGEKESVHLEDWVAVDELSEIEAGILGDMKVVRWIAEKVHAVRKKNSLRLRLPLPSVQIARGQWQLPQLENLYVDLIKDEVNVKDAEIAEGVGLGSSVDESYEKYVDIRITRDLEAEGIAADVTRLVADARKKAGFSVHDKAVATINVDDQTIREAIETHKASIMSATGLTDLQFGSVEAEPVKVEGREISIHVTLSS